MFATDRNNFTFARLMVINGADSCDKYSQANNGVEWCEYVIRDQDRNILTLTTCFTRSLLLLLTPPFSMYVFPLSNLPSLWHVDCYYSDPHLCPLLSDFGLAEKNSHIASTQIDRYDQLLLKEFQTNVFRMFFI